MGDIPFFDLAAQYQHLKPQIGETKQDGEVGVPSAVHYPLPMCLQAAYPDYGHGEGSLPVSESLCCRVMSLPMHAHYHAHYIEDATADRIRDALLEAVR